MQTDPFITCVAEQASLSWRLLVLYCLEGRVLQAWWSRQCVYREAVRFLKPLRIERAEQSIYLYNKSHRLELFATPL